jgi:hypothetical protein
MNLAKDGRKIVFSFVLGNENWVGEVMYVQLLCAGEKRDSGEFENLGIERIGEGTGKGKTSPL